MLSPLTVTTMDGGNAKRLSGTIFAIHAGKASAPCSRPLPASMQAKKNRCKAPVIKMRESYSIAFGKVSPIHLTSPKTNISISINHVSIEYIIDIASIMPTNIMLKLPAVLKQLSQ
jgi:hypothetical protein